MKVGTTRVQMTAAVMSDQDNPYAIDKRQARRAFERAAATYDAAAALQYEVGDRMMERLDYIRLRPARVLDLGAGTGRFASALLKRYRGADVVALDIAPAMLAQTQARGGWLRKPRCVCADAERLPFADDSFDLVFSNLMLQWSGDLEATLAGLLRVVAPGGLLMFTTFGPDTLPELRASWADVDGDTHVNRFIDLHDIGDMLVRTRWAEPVMDAERFTVTYRELPRLCRDLKQIGAHNVTAGRPRGLTGRRHWQQFSDAYERYRSDGLLPASYEVVYGHAWSPPHKHAAGGTEVPLASLARPGSRHG
ncbi:MAG: malonyl-ACP O-methyltransferase BioC [Thiohalobacterales bacterium]|nr:malonyl-ACP O-methyltransferase BioC [Thiohalobacterales bacterium]